MSNRLPKNRLLLVAEDEVAIETLAVLSRRRTPTKLHMRGGHCGSLPPLSLEARHEGFSVLSSMRSIHFDVQGFSRTYWDLFVAAGFSVGVFYLFAAVLAWQLGGLPAETLAVMRVTVWALALCFAAITVVSWRYLFILPIVFSIVITVCLTAAAWLSAKRI